MEALNPSPKDTFHVGQITINQVKDRIYFTRCEYVDNTLRTRCDLYFNYLDPQGNLVGRPIEVAELNQRNSTLTHPSLGWDPVREREVLYFASDRPGTRGNMDIWRSELVRGRFTPPTNDLAINTKGNEITPFYQNGILYFSSDGQPDRYGGYDIFYTPDPQSSKPFNLGQKINSSADESYYSRNEEGNLAYFSSNRLTSNTLGIRDDLKESGSQDIYYYLISKPSCTLEVNAFSACPGSGATAQQALDDVTVRLFDITEGEKPAGRQGIEPSFTGENNYRFDHVLRPNRKYRLVGTRDGFAPQEQILDFLDGRRPCVAGVENIELHFRCDQPLLEVRVYQQKQEVRDAVVRIIPVSGGNQSLRGQSKKAASGAQIPCGVENNWSVSYADEKRIAPFTEATPIEFDQTYLIIADLDRPEGLGLGFTWYEASSESDVFCGKACRDMVSIDLETIPNVQLFFEAGVPGPDPYDVSNLSYLMTLDRYQKRKALYLEQFPASDRSEGNLARRAQLEQFFSEQLDQSFPAFYEFLQQATDLLCQNIPITLEAKACTTPGSVRLSQRQEEYIQHLLNRRLESIQQELLGFGLSRERWDGLFRFKSVKQTCEESGQLPTSAPEAWLEQEKDGLSPASIDSAPGRRVELSLKIGQGIEN
jgi:hypothetical protein